jgi:hypothetical protein
MESFKDFMESASKFQFPNFQAKMKQMTNPKNFKAFVDTVLDSKNFKNLTDEDQGRVQKMIRDRAKEKFGKMPESVEALFEDLRLSPRCKKVIDAFIDHRPDACKKIRSDGNILDGNWFGGNNIAVWKGGKIHFGPNASRSIQTVQNAVRRMTPKLMLAAESVDLEEKGQRTFGVVISLGGTSGETYQIKGDPEKPAQFADEIKRAVKSKTGKTKFKIQKIEGIDPKVVVKLRKMVESFQAEYICEKKPGKGTNYVEWSSIFDNPANKYDADLFAQTLKSAGAKKVWTDNAFGWSNQPEVVLFTGLAAKAAQKALDALPVFKKWGAIIGDANAHWD